MRSKVPAAREGFTGRRCRDFRRRQALSAGEPLLRRDKPAGGRPANLRRCRKSHEKTGAASALQPMRPRFFQRKRLATCYFPVRTHSIIAAEVLHVRVRDGNGCYALAMVTSLGKEKHREKGCSGSGSWGPARVLPAGPMFRKSWLLPRRAAFWGAGAAWKKVVKPHG